MRVREEREEAFEEQLYLYHEGYLRVGRRELQDRMQIERLFFRGQVILEPEELERRRFDLLQSLEHDGRVFAQDRRAQGILDSSAGGPLLLLGSVLLELGPYARERFDGGARVAIPHQGASRDRGDDFFERALECVESAACHRVQNFGQGVRVHAVAQGLTTQRFYVGAQCVGDERRLVGGRLGGRPAAGRAALRRRAHLEDEAGVNIVT